MGFLKTIFGGAWQVLRTMQSIVGTLLFVLLVYFIIAALLPQAPPHVPKGAALVFNPSGFLVEQYSERDPLEVVLQGDDLPPEVRRRDIARVLDMAAADTRIAALFISLDYFAPVGPADAQYIANLIRRFKDSGKPVIAWGDGYSQGHYMIAAQADTLLMHPAGSVLLAGYGIYPTYMRGGLDMLGVEVNVFRHGDYKSAADPFLFSEMPPAAQESTGKLVNSIWNTYLDSAARARGMDASQLSQRINATAEELAASEGNLARHALATGLIDGLATRQQVRQKMADLVGVNGHGDSFKQIDMREYLDALGPEAMPSDSQIAVVTAVGTVMNGEQTPGIAGGRTVARHIRDARLDEDIKAIVLRIDSPGGSAFASETIRYEIDLAREAGKPVVASMGNLAASGGYWIAAKANEIVAQPSTITGSIGIVAILPTFAGTLDKIGMNVDGVGSTPLAQGYHPGMPLSDNIRSIISQSLDAGYSDFLHLVASGRDMEVADVDAIAQGRVWSGADAYNLGLVDHLGVFEDALARAADLAGLDRYSVLYVEDEPSFEDQLLMNLFNAVGNDHLREPGFFQAPAEIYLRGLVRDAGGLLKLNDPDNIYAICLECRIR